MAFGKFLLSIETTMYVLIDALRNISPSELKGLALPLKLVTLPNISIGQYIKTDEDLEHLHWEK